MRLREIINSQPAAVAFGMRRAGGNQLAVQVQPDSIRLISGQNSAVLPPTTATSAGVFTAADKSKLDSAAGLAMQFRTRAEFAATNVPSGATILRTSGCLIPGDGGEAMYRRVESQPGHPGKFQSGDGSWWELLPDCRGWNALALGLIGDYDPAINSGTDNAPLLVECVETLPATGGTEWEGGQKYYNSIRPIYFPSQQFFFGSTIDLKNVVQLLGTSGGMWLDGGTMFVFAADTAGIVSNFYNTTGVSGVESTNTTASNGSLIEGIQIVSLGGTDRTKHGIVIRGRTQCRRTRVHGFPGDGFHLRAHTGDPSIKGNANLTLIENCISMTNGRHGFFATGIDANACTFLHCNAQNNGGAGFWDESLIGNNYLGCHSAYNGGNRFHLVEYPAASGTYYSAVPDASEADLVNTVPGTDSSVWRLTAGSYPTRPAWTAGQPGGTYRAAGPYITVGANNWSRFLGCYAEIGQGPIFLGASSIITGQVGSVAVFGGVHLDAVQDHLLVNGAVQAKGPAADGTSIDASIGEAINHRALAWRKLDASGATVDGDWRLQHDATHADWWFIESGITSRVPFSLTGPNTLYPEPYRLAAPKIILGNHVRNATLSSSNVVGTGALAPTSGTWRQGEYLLAHTPAKGDFVGMACVTTGTAGAGAEFAGFGQVGALKGTTASRPILGSDKSGYMYLDTDLAAAGKPIWWTGTEWVDATGTIS